MNSGLSILNEQGKIPLWRIVLTVLRLSVPAILAEVTAVIMQYIDSAMVGSLGEGASAAIGIVSSSTWLLNGLCIAFATGFSVQIAQYVGAGREDEARSVFRQSLLVTSVFGALLGAAAIALSGPLPGFLGGDEEILFDASAYFFFYGFSLPLSQLRHTAGSALQCAGDMRTPGALNVMLCVLNVILNFFLIFPSKVYTLGGLAITIPGADLGVAGAALGTTIAEAITALAMLIAACVASPRLRFRLGGSWRLRKPCLTAAARISIPAAIEHSVMCTAYVAATGITAPLGKVKLAANSLAVTAESFCYMPGYGVGAASVTLVGQAMGAERKDLARRFAWTSVGLGVVMMSCSAAMMYVIAPWMLAVLTPSLAVRELGVQMLRIVAFAEPFYAAAIVCADALRGAGDTAVPSLLNLISMWGVRITLSLLLVGRYGLHGIWYAMCADLVVRGLLFLARLARGKWLNKRVITVT